MPSVKVYNISGAEIGKMDLSDSVFAAEYNESLIHQAVVTNLCNMRQGTKSALTRAEVRGGGAKPWRQKGTGRARQGSIRSPQWNKGGVVFAPKPRDFSKKMNRTARRNALKSALSYKVSSDEFIVLDELKLAAPKTKEMAQILKNFKLDKQVLLVAGYNEEILRASNNIPFLTVVQPELLSVYEVVKSAKIVLTKDAVKKIEEVHA